MQISPQHHYRPPLKAQDVLLLPLYFYCVCLRASAVREPRSGPHRAMLTFGSGEPLRIPAGMRSRDVNIFYFLFFLFCCVFVLCCPLGRFGPIWPRTSFGSVEVVVATPSRDYHIAPMLCCVPFFCLLVLLSSVVEEASHQSCWSLWRARQQLD